ncbi:MAG TPA: RNA 2',3'-cyclic phosphodiesterase, partial [Candidatus Moranbacteria bacterium]|nr:RNA 2',3'-cyclic phosphodiesterase [Candidatus Moranbacteria bacterium]
LSKRLMDKMAPYKELPVKWVRQENLHVTVAFIGYVDESQIGEICEKVRVATENTEAFDLELAQITFLPDDQAPQAIVALALPSKEMLDLVEKVEKALGTFVASRKEYRAHITLGRIRAEKWDALEEAPRIDEKLHAIVSVEDIKVVESVSQKGGVQYLPLEVCPLI